MKKQITLVLVMLGLSLAAFGQCKDPAYKQAKSQFLQQLPSYTQAKIWRNHVRFALQTEDLDDTQTAILLEGLTLIQDDAYGGAPTNKAGILDYANRVGQAFPDKSQYARIFAFLTPEELKGFSIVKANYKRFDDSSSKPCACSSIANLWCDNCYTAGNMYPSCGATSSGCGPFWLLECDGVCVINGQVQ